MKSNKQPRKKMNKKQRAIKRAEQVKVFEEGFQMGWELRNQLCTCEVKEGNRSPGYLDAYSAL